MNKYRVDISESIIHSVYVSAENEEQARNMAYEFVMNGYSDEAIESYAEDSLGTGKIETYRVDE